MRALVTLSVTLLGSLMLFGLAACDSGNSTPAERDRYGQCYQVASQPCPEGKVYYDCIASACGSQLDACLVPCAAAFDCQKACPCDDTNTDCVTACGTTMTSGCSTCIAPALACVNGAACVRPECLTVDDVPLDVVESSPEL